MTAHPAYTHQHSSTTPPADATAGTARDAGMSFEDQILPHVSRTFALTIPELPEPLRRMVTTAYLLCRLADTIEDDPGLTLEEKQHYHGRFAAALNAGNDGRTIAGELTPRLSQWTLEAERDLMSKADQVIAVARIFGSTERAAIERCLRVMCEGMSRFQNQMTPQRRGLANLDELHQYCYYVAGCVGEMLTELFCAYAPHIQERREELMARAVSFGQGLQMTNILKDIWDDLERGYCWLPRAVFERSGFDLEALKPGSFEPAFGAGLGELVGVARGHLEDALDYTLLIPASEPGIRRFCLSALGMAVLTLRKVYRHRDFSETSTVKISRRSVRWTFLAGRWVARRDGVLRGLMALGCRGLPPRPAGA